MSTQEQRTESRSVSRGTSPELRASVSSKRNCELRLRGLSVCVQAPDTRACSLQITSTSSSSQNLTLSGFTFRMGAPTQGLSLSSLGPTSIQQGQLPLPGGLLHHHPCRSLQRGWLTPHRSRRTCTPLAGQPRAPAARCQTPAPHCRALLRLPQDSGGGGVNDKAASTPLCPPAPTPRLQQPHGWRHLL